jgi:hypothetical protein
MLNKPPLQNIFKFSKGQALIEAALITPLLAIFLIVIIWFAKVALTYQQLIGAARYGTDLIANTPFSKEYIERDIKDYLCNKNTIGRILNPDKLNIEVVINDFPSINAEMSIDSIAKIPDLITIVSQFSPIKQMSYVELTYSYQYPAILRRLGADTVDLKIRNEVLSGNGSAKSSRQQR